MSRIVISEIIDPIGLDLLAEKADVHYDPSLWQSETTLKAWGSEADALIVRNQTRVDASLLDSARHLKVVGRLGVGLDNIDVNAAHARGIRVVAARGANAVAVAEYVFACLLHASRQLASLDAGVRAGRWDRSVGGSELFGKTLGLVGLGDIGQRVALRARVFGMHVMAYDPWQLPTHLAVMDLGVAMAELDTLLGTSDYLSIHVPLTNETRALINSQALSRMKSSAWLINSSRGQVIDEAALLESVQSGRLAGAFLDVRAMEPPPVSDPLRNEPRIVLTPHISGLTKEAGERTARMVVTDVLRVLAGQAPMAAV